MLGNDSPSATALNHIVQYARLTSLTFTKIKFEGLRNVFELYRDRCVARLKDPIERTIDQLRSEMDKLEVYDEKAQMFAFAYSRAGAEGVLEYIGISINKVNNLSGHETFDYTVYTCTYEEPKVVEEPEEEEAEKPAVEGQTTHQKNDNSWRITKMAKSAIGIDTNKEVASSSKNKNKSKEINQGSNRKSKISNTPEISLEDKIAALKYWFAHELANKRNLLVVNVSDGKYDVTKIGQ